MFILNGNAERIMRALKACGLTEYEAKAYFTLLLCGKSSMGSLSKASAVPQSKIYFTVDSLRDRGIVDVTEDCHPKVVTAMGFEGFIRRETARRRRQVAEMESSGVLIRDTIKTLRPIAERHAGRFRVFEPKYLRRRRRLMTCKALISNFLDEFLFG
ncbi:MAG: helix-turn-helix domain-containing protein [Candidatus Bathyarchaeia archaeon]